MYIVKNGKAGIYIWKDGSIYRNDEIIHKNVRENFTLTLGDDGNIYIFTQNNEGNVFLNDKEILHNVSDKIYDVLFEAVFQNGGAVLFYEINNALMMQKMENNQWSKAVKIDEIKNGFRLFRAGKKYILFYNRRGYENQIGYRIIEDMPEEYKAFYKTPYKIEDSSAIFFENAAHCVFIIKNMFSSYLIYKGSMGTASLYDGAGISKCCIFGESDKICAVWEANGRLYCRKGESGRFSSCLKIGTGEFEKANIIGMSSEKVCINELFADKLKNYSLIDAESLLDI